MNPIERTPVLLMAVRKGSVYEGLHIEAEPVLVAHTSTEVILVLDDGEELRFNSTELRAALSDAQRTGRSEGGK